MSKTFRTFPLFFAASVLILHTFNNSQAQDIEVRIKISADTPATAQIEGKYLSPKLRKNPRNLSFLNEYGTATGLAERISNVVLADNDGHPIANKRFIAGEYVADADIASWKYRVDLTPPKQQSAAAHVSWSKGNVGLLLLDDLLPQSNGDSVSGHVMIDLPDGWKVYTRKLGFGALEKSSFVIGRDFRKKDVATKGVTLQLFISGDWQFTDDEAANLTTEIYENYRNLFGSVPNQIAQVSIMKFPIDVSPGNWEADTRGNSITILSSDAMFKSQSLQRLHEQLRHEIFHLWIPNGVNLAGNYDWFYEGFALYQSLKLGVAVNRIRFDDMLDTLSRAYQIDTMAAQKLSLIDASKNRWSGANTQVYARGMLVAFQCDLALLEKSKGKRSVTDLLRQLYDRHRPPNAEMDGNAAVLGLLRSYSELWLIVDRNITGVESIEWASLLKAAGLETESKYQLTQLKVTAKPSGRQKDLLDKLGYNTWRKLSNSSR